MAKTLEVSVDINKDVDTVFNTLCSEEYIKAKMDSIGARETNVKQAGANGTEATLIYARKEKAEAPSALKKFVKEWNDVESTDQWTGAAGGEYTCHYKVDMSGPVDISGVHTLVPNGAGTTSTIKTTIKCGIPLVGKKLEEFVAGLAQASLDDDVAFQKKFIEG